MIEARELSKVYEDGTRALDRLSLHVGRGEIYCLLGANGAGKTTAINLFMDFIRPSSGEALINGTDASRNPLKAKRHVSYLSENVQLYPNLTAMQNILFFARLGGAARADRETCREALLEFGLDGQTVNQKVSSFSKGMRQKLGLAICLLKDTPALILDEPMAGLDPDAAADLVQTLIECRESGKAVLMATHDIFRTRELADRVGILRGGRKVFECSRDELAGLDLQATYLELVRNPGGNHTPGAASPES